MHTPIFSTAIEVVAIHPATALAIALGHLAIALGQLAIALGQLAIALGQLAIQQHELPEDPDQLE